MLHFLQLLSKLNQFTYFNKRMLLKKQKNEVSDRDKETGDFLQTEGLVKDETIAAYKDSIVSIAVQYQNRGLELSDLISAGTLALIEARAKFDPHRGYQFSTYALLSVRQAMLLTICQRC